MKCTGFNVDGDEDVDAGTDMDVDVDVGTDMDVNVDTEKWRSLLSPCNSYQAWVDFRGRMAILNW